MKIENYSQAHIYSCKTLTWYVTLDLLDSKPYSWASNYNSFVVVMLYHNPMNFFDNFFALPLSIANFHYKQLNNSFKIHWRSCTTMIFCGRTLYGKPILLVFNILTIKLMHTTLLLILQDVPPWLNFFN